MLIGTDPSFAAERRYRAGACDDAQIRIRRVLALLEAARGAVIHDLTTVIDGNGDEDVRGAAARELEEETGFRPRRVRGGASPRSRAASIPDRRRRAWLP